MAVECDDNSWIAELESALKEDCARQEDSYDDIYDGQVLPESLRPEVWKSCLLSEELKSHFDDIFDLPEQETLRQDCQQFVAQLGNDEEDKVAVLSDVESVLTAYRKASREEYVTGNGWLDLVAPLLALKLPRSDTLSLLQAIVARFVPRHPSVYHLLRLLLLYHEPKLCSFLDTKRITPETYASTWLQTLFTNSCSIPTVSAIWDLHFQQGDPFFVLFLSLVLVIHQMNNLFEKRQNDSKESLIEYLKKLPSSIQAEDVNDFCSLAQYYARRTPESFRADAEGVLFEEWLEGGENSGPTALPLAQALCLPLSVRELIDSVAMSLPIRQDEEQLRFFLVDCRPPDQYNAGHLPTAFHLDPNLMLQGGEVYRTAVEGLLRSQQLALEAKSRAAGDHLCFMGCGGSILDDQFTHMIVASFLHSNTQHVSLLTGGYEGLHEYFADSVDSMLVDHSSVACLVCLRARTASTQASPTSPSLPLTQSPSKDILGKIGAAVKLKSAEVKDKLLEYIVNPGGADPERHVSSRDSARKRYRNLAPVFSIDDTDPPDPSPEQCGPEIDDSLYEVVSLSSWLKKPEIVATYSCEEIKMNGESHKSHLLVSSSHVYILRCCGRDSAKVVTRRPLLSIAKITCKKRNPTVITFKYSTPHTDSQVISDMDRFVIPKAKEATTVISSQIVKLLDDEKGSEGVKE